MLTPTMIMIAEAAADSVVQVYRDTVVNMIRDLHPPSEQSANPGIRDTIASMCALMYDPINAPRIKAIVFAMEDPGQLDTPYLDALVSQIRAAFDPTKIATHELVSHLVDNAIDKIFTAKFADEVTSRALA